VSHDPFLRLTRTALLRNAGYDVIPVESDDRAITSVNNERFDLVLIGRSSTPSTFALDQRLRERYPALPVLKITHDGEKYSPYPTRVTDSEPCHVLAALREMLRA
jgi:DNA-binding NtrC family response regulator